MIRNDPFDRLNFSSNNVTSLVFQGEDYLWVGTDNGLSKFVSSTGRFEGTDFRKGINALFLGRAEKLWIGTFDGLSRMNPRTYRYTTLHHDPG